MRRSAAFTLIELLIVVAIIAILAAIAVPNFLEAQTRSKVSRTRSDMRTMATALESYYTDSNAYPNSHRFGVPIDPGGTDGGFRILERLSTPVAYISSALIVDPFEIRTRTASQRASGQLTETPTPVVPIADAIARYNSYVYQSFNGNQRYTLPPDSYSNPSEPRQSRAWVLHSAGPDGNYQNLGGVLEFETLANLPSTIGLMYDASNGTISFGSIYRSGGERYGNGYGSGLVAAIDMSQ